MIEQILCAIFGHRYVVEKHIAPHWRKVGCTRCFRSWGMHDPTRAFVPWDGEQEEMANRLHGTAAEVPIPPGECLAPNCDCEAGCCIQRAPATFRRAAATKGQQ